MTMEELQLEQARLQAQKLRHEIRELTAAPWRRPAWLASTATIAAGIIGLVWALLNGYFETRIRELKLETRDLQAGRDAQSTKFRREQREYQLEISRLRERARLLEQRVLELDIPLINNIGPHKAPWREYRRFGLQTSLPWELELLGSNFGTQVGQVQVIVMSCNELYCKSVADINPSVTSWRDAEIRIQAAFANSLDQNISAICGVHPSPRECVTTTRIIVTRRDGTSSPYRIVEFEDFNEWVLQSPLSSFD